MTSEKETQLQGILTLAHTDYGKALGAHAFFKVHNKAISEDLVQDTFVKTWIYLVKRGEIHMMKAFLYHVLNGLIIDQYRKHKTTSLDILLEKGFEPAEDESARQINILDGKAAVLSIKLLPLRYQKIMRMRYVEELSLSEMSILTGKTKNSLAVQAHRGLDMLKVLYIPV